MACPSCGSTTRHLIAPGYWECDGAVTVGLQGNMPLEARCGQRYQEGPVEASLGLCRCGTAAISRCIRCSQPACGDHSRLVAERRVCTFCLDEEQGAALMEQRRQAAEKQREEQQRDRELREGLLQNLPPLVPQAVEALKRRGITSYPMARWNTIEKRHDGGLSGHGWVTRKYQLAEHLGNWWWNVARAERRTRAVNSDFYEYERIESATICMSEAGDFGWQGHVVMSDVRAKWWLPAVRVAPPCDQFDLEGAIRSVSDLQLGALVDLEVKLHAYINGTDSPRTSL